MPRRGMPPVEPACSASATKASIALSSDKSPGVAHFVRSRAVAAGQDWNSHEFRYTDSRDSRRTGAQSGLIGFIGRIAAIGVIGDASRSPSAVGRINSPCRDRMESEPAKSAR